MDKRDKRESEHKRAMRVASSGEIGDASDAEVHLAREMLAVWLADSIDDDNPTFAKLNAEYRRRYKILRAEDERRFAAQFPSTATPKAAR